MSAINEIHVSVPPKNTQIFAIANQKGGVGKTTTAINLATAMAAVNKKVLLIDLDPQGNASTGLGIDRKQRQFNSYHLVAGLQSVKKTVKKTHVPHLDVIPSGIDLAGADIELVTAPQREFYLKKALKDQVDDYDYVLIDCPPSLNLLTLNALVAASSVLVPLQCEFYALEGISLLIKTVERVRRIFNPALEIQGVVLTMFDRRNNLSDMVAQDVRNFFGSKVFTTVIPRNVRVSEAPSHGKPVLLYDWRCAGSQAYINLASEFLKRTQQQEIAA